MRDTSLGGQRRSEHRHREVCLELAPGTAERDLPQASRWFGNTDYWRELGCPSGGLLSTAPDMCTFMNALLPDADDSRHGAPRLLSSATRAMMTRPHTHDSPPFDATIPLPPSVRHTAAWDGTAPSCWALGLRVNLDGTEKQLGLRTHPLTFGQ